MSSDDDNEGDNAKGVSSGDEVEEDDDGKHSRMLQGITGMPGEAFEGILSRVF